MHGRLAPRTPEAAAQRLAIHGDEQPFTVLDQRPRPVREATLKTQRVEHAEHAVERVVRRNAVRQLQELAEPFDIAASPGLNAFPTVRSAQDGEDGDGEDVAERMTRVVGTGILHAPEKAQQTIGRLGVHAQAPSYV